MSYRGNSEKLNCKQNCRRFRGQ